MLADTVAEVGSDLASQVDSASLTELGRQMNIAVAQLQQ